MRKLIISLAAAGTVFALATPAGAQYARNTRGQLEQDVRQLRIDRDGAARSGRLTGREARDVDLDIQALQNSLNEASRGGISYRQMRVLQERVNRIRGEIRQYANNDRGRR